MLDKGKSSISPLFTQFRVLSSTDKAECFACKCSFTLLLSFFGPVVPYLIIYKKKNNSREGEFKQGCVCSKKLHHNWCSVDNPRLSLACVFITWDIVCHSIFIFRKFVNQFVQRHSWQEILVFFPCDTNLQQFNIKINLAGVLAFSK